MPPPRTARDNRLLDAIEALPAAPFHCKAWRVTRLGRDPLQCSAVGGRWDDRTFDVLYTSTKAEGALAEMHFHLSRGQPVMPSQVEYCLHELDIALQSCVTIPDLASLAALGLDTSRFGQLSYAERIQEYPRTQEIAEAAHFHRRDGLLVPSARSPHPNLVVFCDPAGPAALKVIRTHGTINWESHRKTASNP